MGQQKKSNYQGLVGVFLPARLFSSPLPSVLIPLRSKPFLAIEGNLVFSLSFQDFFSYLPPPNPLESPEIKDFRGLSLFSFQEGEEAGSVFEKVFRRDFSGVSGAFRRGIPSCFYGKNLGRGEGKRVGRGRGCGGGGGKIKICH